MHNSSFFYYNFRAFIVVLVLVLCACSSTETPGSGTEVPPVSGEPTPPDADFEISSMVAVNEGYDVQETEYPVDTEISISYINDLVSYSPPLGYIRSVQNYNTNTSDEFIDAYYEPVRRANPEYISRRTIGLDDTGKYTMWCYTFTPENYETSVYIQAGVHGRNEFESFYAIAMMMHLITDAAKSDDPHLHYLREKVRFIVVPVINVFDVSRRAEIVKGIATGGTYSPYNGNNIRLNRSWFNEAAQEVKNVKTLLNEYKDDEFSFALDAHTDPEGLPGWGGYLTPYADGMPEEINSKILAVADFLYKKNIVGKVTWNGEDLLESFRGGNKDYPKNSAEWRANHDKEDYERGLLTNSFAQGFWDTYGIIGLTGEHGARKFGQEGSKIEMCRAVELYLNHILVHLENVEQ